MPLYYSFDAAINQGKSSFVAVRETTTVPLTKAQLEALMRALPDMAFAMMDAWAGWATYALYNLVSTTEDVKTRVVRFLLMNSNGSLSVEATHEQIAQTVGASREQVSRVLSELRVSGAVATRVGEVLIEPDVLLALLQRDSAGL